jgi:hypothetical protein
MNANRPPGKQPGTLINAAFIDPGGAPTLHHRQLARAVKVNDLTPFAPRVVDDG